jgi:enoyl-[acyl-carrier protein] reductase II
VLRTPFLEYWTGRPDQLARRAGELGSEMFAAITAGNGHEYIPFAGQSSGLIGDILPAAEIMRRSLAQAEDALARTLSYRAVGSE